MAERPDSLLHPTRGYAASRIARDLGASTEGRLRQLEARVEGLRQSLTHDLKLFRGIRVGDDGHLITPDDSGYMHFWPAEGSGLQIQLNPSAMRHGAEWDSDGGGGCDCCWEDVNFNLGVTNNDCAGVASLQGPVFNDETCTYTWNLVFDWSVLCDCCRTLGGGGGG